MFCEFFLKLTFRKYPDIHTNYIIPHTPATLYPTYRVWHESLWATLKMFNISRKLIETIQSLYENAMSAVLVQVTTGEWFHTSVGVRQGCLPSHIPLQHLSRGYSDICPRKLLLHLQYRGSTGHKPPFCR